jgi:hypothetical protein
VLKVGRDDGSVMLLIIGSTAIAATLIVVGVQVSKVFLARRGAVGGGGCRGACRH